MNMISCCSKLSVYKALSHFFNTNYERRCRTMTSICLAYIYIMKLPHFLVVACKLEPISKTYGCNIISLSLCFSFSFHISLFFPHIYNKKNAHFMQLNDVAFISHNLTKHCMSRTSELLNINQ